MVDYSGETTVEESYDRVVVFGSSRSVEGEAFEVRPVGQRSALTDAWIRVGSETIRDPADGHEFTRGIDYEMDWKQGGVLEVDGGDFETGATYEADYTRRYRGSATFVDVADIWTLEEQFPEAISTIEWEQIAFALLKRVNQPLEAVEATVDLDDPTVSVVEAISHPELPFDGPLVPRGLEFGQGSVRWRLGTRQTIGEAVDEIRSRLRSVAERSP